MRLLPVAAVLALLLTVAPTDRVSATIKRPIFQVERLAAFSFVFQDLVLVPGTYRLVRYAYGPEAPYWPLALDPEKVPYEAMVFSEASQEARFSNITVYAYAPACKVTRVETGLRMPGRIFDLLVVVEQNEDGTLFAYAPMVDVFNPHTVLQVPLEEVMSLERAGDLIADLFALGKTLFGRGKRVLDLGSFCPRRHSSFSPNLAQAAKIEFLSRDGRFDYVLFLQRNITKPSLIVEDIVVRDAKSFPIMRAVFKPEKLAITWNELGRSGRIRQLAVRIAPLYANPEHWKSSGNAYVRGSPGVSEQFIPAPGEITRVVRGVLKLSAEVRRFFGIADFSPFGNSSPH